MAATPRATNSRRAAQARPPARATVWISLEWPAPRYLHTLSPLHRVR